MISTASIRQVETTLIKMYENDEKESHHVPELFPDCRIDKHEYDDGDGDHVQLEVVGDEDEKDEGL